MSAPDGSPGWKHQQDKDVQPAWDSTSRVSTPTTIARGSPVMNREFQAPTRRQPGSPTLGMYFSPTAQKTISVLHRPQNPPMSMKNVANQDAQYEKDQVAAERHSNAYRRLAAEKWHHNGPTAPTLLEQGHIVDRGRGRTLQPATQGLYDPILSEYKIPPWDATGSKRPSSAPHTRRPVTAGRADKVLQDERGVRNPITGACKPGFEPSAAYEALKKLQFERNHGGRGILSRADKDQSFNPITGQVQPVSPAAKMQPRPQSAPRGSVYSASVTLLDKPQTPSKRQIHNGVSWGQYNPVLHQWNVSPNSSKFTDPSAQLDKTHGLTGNHWRKVALPPNQGVYNPILNQWTVPPGNPRVAAGLAFAPATLFSRATPSTIRTS